MTIHSDITARGPLSARTKDIAGQRFGKLTAILEVPSDKKGAVWLCVCDCGKTGEYVGWHLRRDVHYSCGCAKRPAGAKKPQKLTAAQLQHKRLYNVWRGMNVRCDEPTHYSYPNYGARGITVCAEWRDGHQAFIEWAIANGYAPGLQIDRINNGGNYEPSNCQWVTAAQNNRNRRSTVLTPEQAQEIRDRLAAGEKPMAIARDMGFGKRYWLVYNIKNNDAWGDAPRNHYKTTDPTKAPWRKANR